MQKWLMQVVTPILFGLTLLLGVIAAGRAARSALHDCAAFSISFTEIDCQPPDGIGRAAFLNEVRSATVQPEMLQLLDEDLIPRLHRAFLAHPWVESVRSVVVGHGCLRVEMESRRAVLAVRKQESTWRTVDRQAIVLAESPALPHLPVLVGDVAASAAGVGNRCGDARIAAAAKTVAFLQPHLSSLRLEDSQVEIIEGEILFLKPGVRVVWGHAPGQEREGEAPAQVKLRRLLDYQKEHGGLDSLEHDVRLQAYQGHFPLSPDERRQTVSFYRR